MNASERDWLLRQQMREQLGYSMTKRVTEVHNQIFHCLSSQLFELGCANSMLISLHWNHQDALLVQKHSLVFSFAHSLLSACVVAETSTHQSCILLLTTRTLALCHLSYRLDRLPASCHTSVLGVKVSDFFQCRVLHK